MHTRMRKRRAVSYLSNKESPIELPKGMKMMNKGRLGSVGVRGRPKAEEMRSPRPTLR